MQSGVLAVPEIKKLLQEHQLLQSLVIAPKAEMFTKITYDSRKARAQTLFICKGNFRPEYLASAKKLGQQVMWRNNITQKAMG